MKSGFGGERASVGSICEVLETGKEWRNRLLKDQKATVDKKQRKKV